jgi:hypothetical protein
MAATATLSCEGCASPLEEEDLRCAICSRATARPALMRPRAVVQILRCRGCGAALAYSAEAGAPRCGFCRDVLVVETPRDPIDQADWVVPFAVPPDAAAASLHGWLSTLGFFRPSDLARTATVEGLVAIAWCGWLVDGDCQVSWAADSNAGSGRSAWAPHAGERPMPFRRIVVPASRGLRERECTRLVPSYDLAALVPTASQPTAFGVVEQFDVQRSAARRIVVAALESEASRRITSDGTVPGSRFRNVHVSILLSSLRTSRVALPAYVLAYRYGDRVDRAIVHGQDPRLAFGDAPFSIARIVLVIVGALVAAAIVVSIIALVSSSS